MTREIVLEVIKKIIGPVTPLGQSSEDYERLKNLETLIWVTDELIEEIIYQSKNNDSYEASVKAIGNLANRFITDLREQFKE